MALALEEEEVRLPGELPKALRCPRRLHQHQQQQQSKLTASHSPRADSSAELAAEETHCCLQQNYRQAENEEVGGEPHKVLERLDAIIERLVKSCKVKPDFELHAGDGNNHHLHSGEEPINARMLEDRLDKIIQRLSQRGHCSRAREEEFCITPPKAKPLDAKLGSYATPNPSPKVSPLGTCRSSVKANDDEPCNPNTPTSSRRIPLLTPRSLLLKFGSSEKLVSPTAGRLSSGRSGRFATALSFLASPRRAGATSFGVGSPKAYDGYMDR